jgi:hypothetical protein
MIGGGTVVSESAPLEQVETSNERDAAAARTLEEIRLSLRGLRFGSVNIIVQDGVVIQIDRTEKRRLR